MKIRVYDVGYQIYLIPYCKVTYTRILNGDYEFIVGWLNKEVVLSF
jgi:hypothetical protein